MKLSGQYGNIPEGWRLVRLGDVVEVMSVEEALAQLREAEQRRDEAVAHMDQLLAEMGYGR